jgi:hypothetical protein
VPCCWLAGVGAFIQQGQDGKLAMGKGRKDGAAAGAEAFYISPPPIVILEW